MDFETETKYTPGWTLPDQATTLELDFESVPSSIPTKIQTKPSKIDRVRLVNNNTAAITKNHDDVYEMTLEEQMQLYEDEWYAAEDAAAEAE